MYWRRGWQAFASPRALGRNAIALVRRAVVEFAATLGHVAKGAIPTAPLITGTVGVEGVAAAFDELGSPERHAKILVEPWH